MTVMNRRDFNFFTATAAAAFCSCQAGPAAPDPKPRVRPNLFYGLSTGSWNRVTRKGEPLPLLKILDGTAASGFNGVRLTGFPEILERNGVTLERLGEELEKRGLKFSTTSFGGAYYQREAQEEILKRWRVNLEAHRRFGARAAVVFPPGPVRPEEEKEAFGEMGRFLNRMGKLALEEFGIRMGLHNHTDSLVETPAQVDRFLEETDPRSVFCAWDTAHLLLGGCDVLAVFKKSSERIVFTDFKDATRRPSPADYLAPNGERHAGDSKEGRFFNSMLELGRGEIDFPALLRLLKEKKYKGWIVHDLDTIRVSCSESWRVAMEYIAARLDPIYQ
ncbi:MAG: TIM barrel protein [Planctomycetes bacterium]|nr:TIM barrel protein [Planctomycetota bacterium]